ncbi:MAG: serine hydrolase [Pseudomonadota bacterium]
MKESRWQTLTARIATSVVVFMLVSGGHVMPVRAQSLDIPSSSVLEAQRVANSLRLASKLLCSGVFVSGRPAERVIEEDLHWSQYNFFDWQNVSWQIDRAKGTTRLELNSPSHSKVTLLAESLFEEGYGCSLLPDSATGLLLSRPARIVSKDSPVSELPRAQPDIELERVLDWAFDSDNGYGQQDTRAVLVVKDGALLAERYASGFDAAKPQLGWSMGKSIAAILLGAYALQSNLDIDAPVSIDPWQRGDDPRRAVTPRHLLNMAAGLRFANPSFGDMLYYTELHDHESVYFRAQDVASFVLGQPLQHVPGEQFAYRNTNTLGIMALLRQKLGDERFFRFADEALFSKIGAASMTLETDIAGNPIISGFVYGTARDWARLGLLVLNDGVVDEKRVFPAGWRDEVLLQPSPANKRYGGQMWLNATQSMAGVPADTGYFLGWGGQVVLVVPSENLVLVRLGLSEDAYFDYLDELTKRVLQAIERSG